jgi:AraC-like DNA-binding protein
MTADYNKVINAMDAKIVRIRHIEFLKSITVEALYEIENRLIMVNSGTLSYKDSKGEKISVHRGDILFVPEGKMVSITYGNSFESTWITHEEFVKNKTQYFRYTETPVFDHSTSENFTFINLEIKVFDSVNLFSSLDIPAFAIKNNKTINSIITNIIKETQENNEGKEKVLRITSSLLAIEIIRYILKNKLFVEKISAKSSYFKDIRLINIFKYINKNLRADLSNKVLASIANVSEDYVGQYFKLLTGINPQDYVEYKRMEQAVKLLRESKESISDIAKNIGFNDTAYFCRRFKMMFGIPAGKMRQRHKNVEGK